MHKYAVGNNVVKLMSRIFICMWWHTDTHTDTKYRTFLVTMYSSSWKVKTEAPETLTTVMPVL